MIALDNVVVAAIVTCTVVVTSVVVMVVVNVAMVCDLQYYITGSTLFLGSPLPLTLRRHCLPLR